MNSVNPILVVVAIIVGIVIVLSIVSSVRNEKARQLAILAHKGEWPDSVIETLISKKVGIGMTGEMVRLSWGSPAQIQDKEITSKGKKTRWVYGVARKNANYLWFTDDKLTKIQK